MYNRNEFILYQLKKNTWVCPIMGKHTGGYIITKVLF